MANTIADVREKVDRINEFSDRSLTFQCWGVGQNRYYLQDDDTGKQLGEICLGSTEFLRFLEGYESGVTYE